MLWSFWYVQKSFWQNPVYLCVKSPEKSNMIKAMYNKPIANFRLNEGKFNVFLLREGTWQVGPISPPSFNIALGVLSRAVR